MNVFCPLNKYLVLLDYVVLAFFTFEVLVKFFGTSVVGNFKVMFVKYFLGPEKWWNIFDLAVVVMSMPGVIPASAGSSIYIFGLFNPNPIDTFVKIRRSNAKSKNLEPGWNLISIQTYQRYFK